MEPLIVDTTEIRTTTLGSYMYSVIARVYKVCESTSEMRPSFYTGFRSPKGIHNREVPLYQFNSQVHNEGKYSHTHLTETPPPLCRVVEERRNE